MIDIESDIYDIVSNAAQSVDANTFVVSKEARTPSKFPCVSVVEAGNSTLTTTRDSGHSENHAVIMYEINVYSNKADGAKAQCKAILSSIDTALLNIGFKRTMKRPVSMDDASKYRLIARYNAVADANKVIYRR